MEGPSVTKHNASYCFHTGYIHVDIQKI